MSDVLHILLGSLFTVAVSFALGSLLLRRLRVKLHRQEAALFAFLAGAACLSLAIFLLCLIHQARRGVLLCLGMAIMIWAFRARRPLGEEPLPALSRIWTVLVLVVLAAFFVVYFFNALAPEVSPDGSGYHLGNVARYWQRHGFVWSYHSMYSYLWQGMEMLFLMAFGFGRHSAAAMVHLAFLAALPLLLLCYGRRFGFPAVSAFAAVVVFTSPVVGRAGTSAYNDLTLATLLFAVFYLLQVWDETRDNSLLILSGLLVGFACSVKYTGGLALPFALGFVWWRSKAGARVPWRLLLAVAFPAAVMMLPWALRNWIWLGNPVAPFFNSWFPNPYYHAGMEKIYLEDLRHYEGIHEWWRIPLELTVGGLHVAGLVGPVFLLAPLALLALRWRAGRRLLLAALLFALPAWFNIGARFLIPSLAFVALALGMALARYRAVLPALAALSAVACWPQVVSLYCDQYAWRIDSIPVRAALRQEPEELFVMAHLGDLALRNAIERNVPPGGKVFSFAGRPEAYLKRDIIVMYESVLGNLAQDVLWAPGGQKPNVRQRFRFLPVDTGGVRVVETASADAFWTVSEMRVYSQGRELPRSPSWRISAWPNGWEAPLAFDNNYATRWSTWQAMAAPDHLQIVFGRAERIDQVDLECWPVREARVQVEVLAEHGRWVPLTDTPEITAFEVPPGIRRAAALELRSRGLGFLLINDSDGVADDMKKYPGYWGITELATSNGVHLYRID